MIVDTIKLNDSFDQDYFDTHIGEFMKIYLKLIVKHPVMAVKAYSLETLGFWNIKETSDIAYVQNKMWFDEPYIMKDKFKDIFGFSLDKILSPKILINYACFIWFMLYTIFYILYKKRKNLLIVIMPNLLVWLTIMVATPLAFSLRYVFSIILSLPIFILCILSTKTNN